jgi:hypothetical protein
VHGRAPIAAAAAGSSSTPAMQAAMARGSSGFAQRPAPEASSNERHRGKSDASTGRPADMYSKILFGCASTWFGSGWKNTSPARDSAMMRRTSARDTMPR